MVALIVLNVKRPIPINLLADVQDCRNHMGSKPEHLVNRVCNKHNYSNCKVVVFLERVAINYFQAYPFQLLEYHIISQVPQPTWYWKSAYNGRGGWADLLAELHNSKKYNFWPYFTKTFVCVCVHCACPKNDSHPHISPRLRCFNREIPQKLCATCWTLHLFWLVISSSWSSLQETPLRNWGNLPLPDHTRRYLNANTPNQTKT